MLNRLAGVFKCFQKHDVKYLVIGGIAAVLYGVPRATFVVCLDDLIAAKKAAGRKVDLEDVSLLEADGDQNID